MGRVLIVAGSDSGGGAGIQADIKAVTALGGYAMTAITALTAQNTLGVHGIHEVPTDFVREQIRVTMEDLGADCVKTGMLHRRDVIRTVTEAVDEYAGTVPLVVDPVMMAKGGAPLLEPDAIECVRDEVLPRATLITPNAPEAAVLSGIDVGDRDSAIRAGEKLLEKGPKAVLIKGGHIDDGAPMVVDILLDSSGKVEIFQSQRFDTSHTHGTGCTMASAIAAGLAQGLSVRDAVVRARGYVHEAIRTAPGYGGGHGPLNHAHPMTRAIAERPP